MANQPNSSFNAGGRTRAVALGQRLSGVALLAALLAGCDNSVAHNAPPPPPVVSAASVVVKPISQWDAFNGRVEAVQSVQLRPRVSGYIERVNYTEGDEVKKARYCSPSTIAPTAPRANRRRQSWCGRATRPPWRAANPRAPRS